MVIFAYCRAFIVSFDVHIIVDVLRMRERALSPCQSAQVFLGLNRWEGGSGSQETTAFVSRKLRDVICGQEVEASNPPPIQLLCSYIAKVITLTDTVNKVLTSRRRADTPGQYGKHQLDSLFIVVDETMLSNPSPLCTLTYPHSLFLPSFPCIILRLSMSSFSGGCLHSNVLVICSSQV
jgi:hypothetical protein